MEHREIQTARVIVKNIGKSPRGINTIVGVVIVDPGRSSREVTIAEHELKSVSSSGFEVEVIGPGEPFKKPVLTVRRTRLGEEVETLRATVHDLQKKVEETSEPPPPPPENKKTVDELLAMAEDKDVPFAKFKAAAYKLLGDSMPNKKDDIVDALLNYSTQST